MKKTLGILSIAWVITVSNSGVLASEAAKLRGARVPAQADAGEVRAAISAFENFQACKGALKTAQGTQSRTEFLRCTDRYLSSELSESHRRKLSGWLFFEFEIRDLRACSEEEVGTVSTSDLERSDAIICFRISAHHGVTSGHVFYRRADGFKILDIKY